MGKNSNIILAVLGGVAIGYFIGQSMAPTVAKTSGVGAFSLTCDCADGSTRQCGNSSCSCCPQGRGLMRNGQYVAPVLRVQAPNRFVG